MLRLFNRFFRLLYRQIDVIVFAREARLEPGPPDALRIQRADCIEQAPALQHCMQKASHWEKAELQRRRALGDACYMALDGEQCVHYTWMTRQLRENSEIGFKADLTNHDWWIYNSFTSPTHRGRSIYAHVLRRVIADASADGSGVVWIDVMRDNRSSLRGVEKAGFVEVARLQRRILFSHIEINRSLVVLDSVLGKRLTRLKLDWTWPTTDGSWN